MDQNQSGFQKFPKGFLFGSATSAHQVEGGNFNSDWYKWEKAGHIKDGETSDPAANSWNKWREDIELLKQTNQNAYRFSIEWSKIEPEEGKFNQDAIEHYRKILLELKNNNIKSMVTLWHFTTPLWLTKIGGFANRKSVKLFSRYAEKITTEFGDLVDFWATFNEPMVYILKGYIQADWPPVQKNLFKSYKVYRNLVKCHNRAYKIMKQLTDKPIGIVENIGAFEPLKNNFINRTAVKLAKYFDAAIFIKPVLKNIDFLGINYYQKFYIQTKRPLSSQKSDLQNDYGWAVNQEGLYQVIMENSKWRKPIYITENGIADFDDDQRPQFLKEAFENIQKAINDGIDVRGYFYWSLLDNFEWTAGYTQKFGLADINRNLRPSAQVYADLIKKHSSD